MQAPLYNARKRQLAILAAKDPATYWGRHGMRDIVPIISGMISQVALSFARFRGGYAILWCDLRDGRKRIIGKDLFYEITNRGDNIRYELKPITRGTEDAIEVLSVYTKDCQSYFDGGTGRSSTFPAGQDMAIYSSTSLIVVTMDGCTFYEAPVASTVRFERGRMLYLDSDGVILSK